MSSYSVGVESLFIGAGCNRIVNNVSWGACNLVAFGAQNAVAVFSPETGQIWTTFPGHKAVVNCTNWIPSSKDVYKAQSRNEHFLLSGDAEGVIILWGVCYKERKWRQVLLAPKSHTKSVTCISGIMISTNVAIFTSSCSAGTVCTWELILPSTSRGDCKLTCLESLSIGPKPIISLSLSEMPGMDGYIVIAMGGLDNKIHLYCGEICGKLVHACELKGHTDWVRCVDFSLPIHNNGRKNTLFLASSSQDRSIRIWKITLLNSSPYKKEEIGFMSYIEGPIILAGSSSYQVSLESLLIGHEDWVYSVEWQPPLMDTSNENEYYQPQSLLSASMDKSMMIWRPEQTTGIWMNVVSVGELSHCALGFYGGHWSPQGDMILAHGYGGSFHGWRNIGSDFENWQPHNVPSGHFAAVSDVVWARHGEYMASVSHDQTTRIFAPWMNEDQIYWHEIARPQVHGHDINCIAVIQGNGNHRFISGADEKVSRVFEAPISFLKTLSRAILQNLNPTEDVQVLGANMSALGLSQKPIYDNARSEFSSDLGRDSFDSIETVPDAVPIVLTKPPVEEQLAWHTLWPESHKLYGHGNEIVSLCCDHEGKFVASSCKAQSSKVAEIWLWEVGSWKAVGQLQSHSLTVTQMEFSSDDSFLLTVSRDRQFSVFLITKSESNKVSYQLVARQEAHKRIIWTCSWNPFGNEFATGSRDKTVKIWGVENKSTVKHLITLPQFNSSVTALSWVGLDHLNNIGFLAIGMESGLIELWRLSGLRDRDGPVPSSIFNALLMIKFDPFMCHVSTVHRLAWRKSTDREVTSKKFLLASCGEDHCVRVFNVTAQQLDRCGVN